MLFLESGRCAGGSFPCLIDGSPGTTPGGAVAGTFSLQVTCWGSLACCSSVLLQADDSCNSPE